MHAPAPWRLTGRGFIAALRLPDALRREQGGYPPHWPAPGGPLSYLMFVDYQSSNVGPYHELLFLDGRFPCPDGGRYWSIGRIYVSSQDSVDNGRANWGLAKDLADFRVDRRGRQTRVTVSRNGAPLARLAFTARGPAVPVHSALVPRPWRELVQYRDGRTFHYIPEARGRAGLAGGIAVWGDGERFPALHRGRCLGGMVIPGFRMTFPVAEITAVGARA